MVNIKNNIGDFLLVLSDEDKLFLKEELQLNTKDDISIEKIYEHFFEWKQENSFILILKDLIFNYFWRSCFDFYKIILEADNKTLRYAQLGYTDNEKFTWLIYDYVWSWNYQQFGLYQWENIEDILTKKWFEADEDDIENFLEEKSENGWIINSYYNLLDEYFIFNDENYTYLLKDKYADTFNKRWFILNKYSNLDWISVWNTVFEEDND